MESSTIKMRMGGIALGVVLFQKRQLRRVPLGPRRICGAIGLPFGERRECQSEADGAGLKLLRWGGSVVRNWSA
jgi:hypothetical protein